MSTSHSRKTIPLGLFRLILYISCANAALQASVADPTRTATLNSSVQSLEAQLSCEASNLPAYELARCERVRPNAYFTRRLRRWAAVTV